MENFNNIDIPSLEAVSVKKLQDAVVGDAAGVKSAIYAPVENLAWQVNSAFGVIKSNLNEVDALGKAAQESANEAKKEASAAIVQAIKEVKLALYPVGALYITTASIDPSGIIGGTWTKLADNAYLKIVSDSAGIAGGQIDHKIPLSSAPKHEHEVRLRTFAATSPVSGYSCVQGGLAGGAAMGNINENLHRDHRLTDMQGGGQPYYPGYYGVYVWKRTA